MSSSLDTSFDYIVADSWFLFRGAQHNTELKPTIKQFLIVRGDSSLWKMSGRETPDRKILLRSYPYPNVVRLHGYGDAVFLEYGCLEGMRARMNGIMKGYTVDDKRNFVTTEEYSDHVFVQFERFIGDWTHWTVR